MGRWALVGAFGAAELADGVWTVGRGPENDVVVRGKLVSRLHAALHVAGARLEVEDRGSRNGTFVNGMPIRRCELADGVQLRFGDCTVLVRDADAEPLPGGDEQTEGPGAPPELSPAQARVLEVLLLGHTEKQVAKRLHLSLHTVHSHVRAIYAAYGVNSRAELMAEVLGQLLPLRRKIV